MSHPLEESHIQRCLELTDRRARVVCGVLSGGAERGTESRRLFLCEIPVEESGPYPLVGQRCGFSEAPSLVIIDREGNYCDMFENLEFIINYPETVESQDHVSNLFFGGQRLLICPDRLGYR